MTLQDIYQSKPLTELIKVLESPNDYTEECVEVVIDEIKSRNIDIDEAKQIAEENLRNNFSERLNSFDPFNDKIKPFNSHFLNQEEVLKIMKEVFDKWLSKRDSYGFDVWLYAVGGIL